jgi:hypothetical protein
VRHCTGIYSILLGIRKSDGSCDGDDFTSRVTYREWGFNMPITDEGAKIIDQAYRESVTAPLNEIAQKLQDLLTRQLTAHIIGVKDGKSITRWANGEVCEVRHESERRLRTTYEIVQLLTYFDSPQVARAWFIGLNPQLDDTSPAEAIHEGKLKEVRAAARAFIVGG